MFVTDIIIIGVSLFYFLVIMDAMKEMKEWLIQKFQNVTSQPGVDKNALIGSCAITPKNIPEFVIPCSNDSSRRTSECSIETDMNLEIKRNSYGGRSIHSTPPGSPIRISPSESAPCVRMLKGNEKCNSAPGTPKHELHTVGCRNGNSASVINDGTNDDPLSFAAMSLPHFRAQTSYGFSTLKEAPHTRRKESLFHTHNHSLLSKKFSLKSIRQDSLTKSRDRSSPDVTMFSSDLLSAGSDYPSSNSMPSVVITSVAQGSPGTPSPEHDLHHILSNRRLSPSYQAFQGLNTMPIPARNNRFYNRRRSSLVNVNENEIIDISDTSDRSDKSDISSRSGYSTPSQHSLDLGLEHPRHSLGDLVLPPRSPDMKRHSAPQITEVYVPTKHIDDIHKQRSSSFHVISKNNPTNHNELFAPHGELKLSFHYLAASKQLKLILIRAENLGGHQKQDKHVNSYAKVYLMPGKIQKQSSSIVKRTKNPIFNQDMFFQNILLEDLYTMTLRIKIFSKPNNLKLQEFIGEVSIPFDGFDMLEENRMWRDLDARRMREELGYLGIGLQYDDIAGIIRIYVDQARQLPQHPITGPPDPYVRVEVAQPNKSVSKKQTGTQKKTANPVFEETYTFSVSTKSDDLQSLSIMLTIFDHERLRSDDVIGHVILGCMATDACQYGHWQEVIESPGEMISKWHYLLESDD